ncbi:MAG: sulfatase-like hydrolase/transferase, partial [Planctomycetaceae bacterium]|nr:sulfatase-like hydrolase/transferase [Planctomycetaceae bacterium]
SFYAQPVCGVSRAALMTGCYPIRVAEPGNIKRLHTVLDPTEWTMAEMFREAGYATAIIGKWHLGLRDDQGIAGYAAETMPNGQGFDFFFGTPAFNGARVFVTDSPFRSPLMRNQQIEVKAVQNWNSITSDYTREALQWIDAHRDRPFFLYLAHNMPHIPLGASEDFRGQSGHGPYADAIEEIDWSCGQIFDRLKLHGLDETTLVVFTSDNGPWIETTQAMKPNGQPFIPRDHSGTADPLRGYKMTAWEGGSRVPCIIRWPGRVPANVVSDEILTTMDLLPTFASLTRTALPNDRTLDGVDATRFLLGGTTDSPRDEYLYYAGCFLTGVRAGQWKLVLPRPASPPGTGWWGRMIEAVKEIELYDLKNDPGEQQNVAASHPDTVAALMQRIDRARRELGDIEHVGTSVRLTDEGPRLLEAGRERTSSKPTESAQPAVPYDHAVPVGNLRFTFEGGDWQGWRVTQGNLGDALTNRTDLPQHKSRPFNKQGDWFLFTGNQPDAAPGNDRLAGTIESPRFVLRGNRISFLVGGGAGADTYVALIDEDGKELRRAEGTNSPVMKRVTWQLDELIDQTVLVRIVDRSQGGWGHLTFDDFSCEGTLLDSAR